MLSRMFDLGFFPEPQEKDRPLWLGRRRLNTRQIVWDVISWFLVALGIFLRHALDLATLAIRSGDLHLGSALASLIVALAVFPVFMRWLNTRRPQPGFPQVATAFSFGFFLDVAVVAAVRIPARFFRVWVS